MWEDQDCDTDGKPTWGIITVKKGTGWVTVKWESGRTDGYRVGADGAFDLYIYMPTPESKPELVSSEKIKERMKAVEERAKEDGYDDYLKSLRESMERAKSKTKTQYGTSTTAYAGTVLYLPPKDLTLKRGDRIEGRRLQG